MYKVLGSDGKEYGPVSAEEVKKWIAEGRVEKKTPVIPEGERDWFFLGSLPEFAAAFTLPSSVPLPVPPPGKSTKSADRPGKASPPKNTHASVAYYLGLSSVIPPLGAFLGIPALALGVSGLCFQRRHPETGGRRQAWIGIVLGGLFGFGYLTLIALVMNGGIVHGHSFR